MAIVGFFEQYASIVSDRRLREHVRIVIPQQNALVYLLFFSQSLTVVSRLCAVLCCYKQGIEMAMAIKSPQKRGPSSSSNRPVVHAEVYQPSETSRFNGFIMDICNCILRMKAFSLDEQNAAGCLIPRRRYRAYAAYVDGLDTNIALPALFGVSHSPIMSLQAILAVRALEDEEMEREGGSGRLAVRHAGPVTQASLATLKASGGLALPWGEYRVAVLRRLDGMGFRGISELAKNTMKTLMKPRTPGAGKMG
jgi:centromere protein I